MAEQQRNVDVPAADGGVAAEERAVGDEPDAMLSFVVRCGTTERKLRLYACACCRRVWPLLVEPRSREALEAAERHGDGAAGALRVAQQKARRAAVSLAEQVKRRGRGLDTPETHAACAVWDAACPPPLLGLHSPALHAAEAARAASADAALEAAAQAHLLRDLFGNPFSPIHVRPDWLTPRVVGLAQAAYEDRLLPSGELNLVRLAVLSDALEEEGADTAILGHLRGPGPHVRGCHVLDLLLNKS